MQRRWVSLLILFFGTFLIGRGVVMLAAPTGVVSGQIAPFEDTACLDCHTDQARLAELAPVEDTTEDAEELSSGPG